MVAARSADVGMELTTDTDAHTRLATTTDHIVAVGTKPEKYFLIIHQEGTSLNRAFSYMYMITNINTVIDINLYT